MDFYENSKVHGIHKSRYLASFFNALGPHHGVKYNKPIKVPFFYEWLLELIFPDGSRLSKKEIDEIYDWATNGKMEFEHDAFEFISRKQKEGS